MADEGKCTTLGWVGREPGYKAAAESWILVDIRVICSITIYTGNLSLSETFC
jgi:hypothetical protein